MLFLKSENILDTQHPIIANGSGNATAADVLANAPAANTLVNILVYFFSSLLEILDSLNSLESMISVPI